MILRINIESAAFRALEHTPRKQLPDIAAGIFPAFDAIINIIPQTVLVLIGNQPAFEIEIVRIIMETETASAIEIHSSASF